MRSSSPKAVARTSWCIDGHLINHMETSEKFLFENCFDLANQFDVEVVEEEIVPPLPTFSEDEIAAARASGFAEGRNEGIAEMQSAIDSRISNLMDSMTEQLAGLDAAQANGQKSAEIRLISLAAAIAKKVVPPIARETAGIAVEEMIRDCLPKLMNEPRVVIRVHITLMDELRKTVDTLASRSGFAGDIILLPDDDIAETDCRVEWADGGAERTASAIWAEIDKTIDAYLGTADDACAITQSGPIPPSLAEAEPKFPEESLNG